MDIIPLNHKRIFTLDAAQEILPIIYRITENSQKEVRSLSNRMEAIKRMSGARASELEEEINLVIERWQQKVIKLGAKPKGLWLADFDFGQGYYCWKFPEVKIRYSHGYNDGFSGRAEIHPEENVH